ncbi:MAG: hypothetical protein WD226_00830 [Planctomycetota bacterium]
MRTKLSCLLLLLVLACNSTSRSDQQAVRDLLFRGDYVEALERAEAARKAGQPWAEGAIAKGHQGALLEEGRRLLLDGQLEKALEVFERADRALPGEPTTEMWLAKTKRELASHLLDVAATHVDRDNLDVAHATYVQALEYEPDNDFAMVGLARTQRSLDYRREQSAAYYRAGLRHARNFMLPEALRDFAVAVKYDPASAKAKERRDLVDQNLVEFHLSRAEGLIDQGLWSAAKLELRQATAKAPDDPEVRAEATRIENEVTAIRLVEDALIQVMRDKFTVAEDLLARAEELSEHQADSISRARAKIEEGRFNALYEEALELERDYRHEDALAAYERLLERAEFYRDAIARRNTLRDFLGQAAELYERAQSAEQGEALALYRQIDVLLPEYRDVAERTRALQSELAAEQP